MLLCGRIALASRSPLAFFPQIWSPRNSLLRFALLHDSLRWTLSFPNFYVVPCALGEFDGVIRSQFSNFPQNRLSEGNLRTHNPIVYTPSGRQLILLYEGSVWSFTKDESSWRSSTGFMFIPVFSGEGFIGGDVNGSGTLRSVWRNMRRTNDFWWARGDKQSTCPWANACALMMCLAHVRTRKNARLCHAYEVCCLHSPSRARHSLMCVR